MFKRRVTDPHIRIEVKGGKWPYETFYENLSVEDQKAHLESFKDELRQIEKQIQRHVDVDHIALVWAGESRCEFCDEPEKSACDADGLPACCDAAVIEWLREHPDHPDTEHYPEIFAGTLEALDALTIRAAK